MKLFKVPLYKVLYRYPKYGELVCVGHVIVQKNFFTVKEILTGYSMIDIISDGDIKNGALDGFSRNCDKMLKYGYHLVIKKSDLVPRNHINSEDLDLYIDSYEESPWKKIYDDMKVQSKEKEKEVEQKVKSVFGTKK